MATAAKTTSLKVKLPKEKETKNWVRFGVPKDTGLSVENVYVRLSDFNGTVPDAVEVTITPA